MKKLPEPDNSNALLLLEDIVNGKRREDYEEQLIRHKNYIINRYAIYEKEKNALENVGVSAIVHKSEKEAIHSSFNKHFRDKMKDDELKKVYEECKGRCPYCGEGIIEEVDHYVPKEDYPEFTLYPNNLIPICSKCNEKKKKKFVDSKNVRKFINFYYDDIVKEEFLSIELYFDPIDIKKTSKIKYMVDFSNITNEYMRKIVQNHYKNLDLLPRYDEAAINEISEVLCTLQDQPSRDENYVKILAEGTILARRNGQLKRAGENDWKYLLYDKLVKEGYIDKLVKYVCNEATEKSTP